MKFKFEVLFAFIVITASMFGFLVVFGAKIPEHIKLPYLTALEWGLGFGLVGAILYYFMFRPKKGYHEVPFTPVSVPVNPILEDQEPRSE